MQLKQIFAKLLYSNSYWIIILQILMQRLFDIFPKIKEKVIEKTSTSLINFKNKLCQVSSTRKQVNSVNTNKKIKQNKLFQQSRIKSKQSIRTYRPFVQTQIERKAEDLVKRKRRLLQQLKHIDDELIKVNQIKNSQKKKQNTEPQEILYQRATDLVSKMNMQRKQLSQKRKKQAKILDKTVQQSISKYQQILQNEEKQKQNRRKQIQKRIQDRKNAVLVRSKINRQSNSLINELKSYRTSLPEISNLSNDPQKHEIQVQSTKKKTNFRTSPFLQKIRKQEESKKRQSYLKGLQKKRVRSKQMQYSMKFRSRAKFLAESATFVT